MCTLKVDSNFLYWLGGFMDGEGSFGISIHKHNKMTLKHQITMGIEITQADCFSDVLYEIRDKLSMGIISHRERNGDAKYPFRNSQTTWRVRKMLHVNQFTNLIIPYLKAKKEIALKFKTIMEMWNKGEQTTVEGFIKMCELRDQVNDHRTKSFSYLNADYFRKYFAENPISEEALKQAKHYRRRPQYIKKLPV